jgi:hypothetical protein
MKQFFTAIWNFLLVIGEARARSVTRYQNRLHGGRWDY